MEDSDEARILADDLSIAKVVEKKQLYVIMKEPVSNFVEEKYSESHEVVDADVDDTINCLKVWVDNIIESVWSVPVLLISSCFSYCPL